MSVRRRRAAVAILVAGVVSVAWGCAPPLAPGTRACVGFPADVCQRQVAEYTREGQAHGGLAAYRIVCTSTTCTTEQGEGTETVVFADGSSRQGGFAYARAIGPPGPPQSAGPLPVAPACLGVPAGRCEELAWTGAEQVVDWSRIVAITVRCTGVCNDEKGDGETHIRLTDGPDQTVGWSYIGKLPPRAP